MGFPVRYIAIGAAVGLILSVGFALADADPVQVTVAELLPDTAAKGFDTSRLVKFDDKFFAIDYDASVSTDVISSTTIKKIEAGRVSYVSVGTTSTGTYSSDALTSKHIQYPGIAVREVNRHGDPISTWKRGDWVALNSLNARSIVRDGSHSCIASATLKHC